jgi:hypothetical protein
LVSLGHFNSLIDCIIEKEEVEKKQIGQVREKKETDGTVF